ncbi:MAG: FAD-dependent oxidoreductase [Deltaproteobacteria bacterium]|nr:FAD-dependent oxidoreductase [Deltaproteobacteria bacterium]
MVSGFLIMGGLGVVIGVVLALASKVFYVYIDPKIEAVEDALPGANCGGCGLPGCSSNAAAIVAGKASASSCVAGGPDVAAEIAGIMGVALSLKEPEIAAPGCTYGYQDADIKYLYQGIHDCRAAVLLDGGSKICTIGCLGLGTCVRACPFGALSMGPDNLPVVDTELCTGCGTCERVCPKHIITLTSTSARIINEYVADECTAPCHRSCPTGINIPGFIKEIRDHNYEAALAIIKEKCPLPLICGYICPAPCELACRRNLVDEAVAINPLKRFVADYEMETGKHITPYKAPATDRKIAVVGGGAEGLTVGYYLARLGYNPTIFEAKPQLGGILRYVIAEDRLPRKVLDHEIEGILKIGVEARNNMVMGRDFHLDTLFEEGFDAVILTKGGFDSRKILQGESGHHDSPVDGLYLMLDFVSALARGERPDPGQRVVILHSGAEAIDLARRCRELGAEEVMVISGSRLDQLPVELQDLKALAAEGISVRHSSVVTGLQGNLRRLTGIVLEDFRYGEDLPPERETLTADTLIISEGRIPEILFVRSDDPSEPQAEGTGWHTVETFRTYPQSRDGMFSPPEPGRISDSSAVVKSLLSGRRVTRAIHQYFTDNTVTPLKNLVCETGPILNVEEVHDVNPAGRELPDATDVEGNSKTAWIFPEKFPGLDEASAVRESERCLQCGLICYRKQA